MVDILLDEVKDDIAQEKLRNAVIKYWKLACLIFISGVFGIIFYIWLQYHEKNEIYIDNRDFTTSMTELRSADQNLESVIAKLNLLSSRESSYATLSKFYLASIYDGKQDYEKAISLYEAIINDKNIDNTFKDFAKLLLINLKSRAGKISISDAISALDLYIAAKPIYRHTAQILQISLYLQENKQDEANNALAILMADRSANGSFIQIAKLLTGSIPN